MCAARAGKGEALQQVRQRQPTLHPSGQRLHPAQFLHLRQQAGGRAPREHCLDIGALRLGGGVLARQRLDRDAAAEVGCRDGIEVGGGRVCPKKDAGWEHERRVLTGANGN